MEEEAVTSAAADAVLLSGLSTRADDRKSEFASETRVEECSNCQATLTGRYCHDCGQVADTWHRPFWSLFGDIFDGLFGFDGRVWRTVPAIIFRPGHVTRRYLSGIRQPYISPFKLFLAASVLFFLAVELSTDDSQNIKITPDGVLLDTSGVNEQEALAKAKSKLENVQDDLQRDLPDAAKGPVTEFTQSLIDELSEEVKTAENSKKTGDDSIKVNLETFVCGVQKALVPEDISDDCKQELKKIKEEVTDTELPEKIQTELPNGMNIDVDLNETDKPLIPLNLELRRKLAANAETAIRDPDRYTATLGRWAPRIGFVLAPLYGLLLAGTFFWRRRLFIYDHMIVALHFHSFLFLFLSLLAPFGMFNSFGWTSIAFMVWSNVYLFQMHRKVYGCNWFTAGLRTIFMDVVYMFVLSLALIALLVLGVVFV